MFSSDSTSERRPDNENDVRTPNGTAEPFVRQAEKLAANLHHKDLRIAHLLLAIAMTGRAEAELSTVGLEAENVRRCCWRSLEEIRPEPDPVTEVLPSGEINRLFGHAAAFSNGQELQVRHILRAVSDVKFVGQFGSLIRVPEPRAEDIDAKMSAIKAQLDTELSEIRTRLDRLDVQQNATNQALGALQQNVGSGSSDGNLHVAADRLKKRMTNVKTWVVLSAAVVITALLVHIIRP